MAKNEKKVTQRKFTNRRGTFSGVSNITEAESLHLPKDVRGRKSLTPGYEDIFEYQLLLPILKSIRRKFKRSVSKIPSSDLDKINAGIAAYVKSSKNKSNALKILKGSILELYIIDNLTFEVETKDGQKEIKINVPYFESTSKFSLLPTKSLINPGSLRLYIEKAQKYTLEGIRRFIEASEEESEATFMIYRGLATLDYYKKKDTKNDADFASRYKGMTESVPYFEDRLLNSYTINWNVAEKFMITYYNQRKCKISCDYEPMIENLFTSFFVSELFDNNQYELLILPNINDLYITDTGKHDDLYYDFHICKSPS
ncbi:MAG: hypothetical protein DCE86_00120 [Flavobacteriaceae bacterium]|nr:MAG: hypothetical protein DCE86_00120 [Flavobacteriaceae bacterium]